MINTIFNAIIEFWWVWVLFLPLFIIWISLKKQKSFAGLQLKDMALIIEMGMIFILIYLCQVYLFSEHVFFLLTFPLAFVINFLFIQWLLQKDDVLMIESQIQNEEFYDILNMKTTYSTETKNRILIMDRSVYDAKDHVGDAQYPFWNGSPDLKFCDKYDDKNGVFYHPQLPQFHNVDVYMARIFMLKMKEEMPKLKRVNIMLTWLSDYKLAHEQTVMKENFILNLKSLKNQYIHDPFKLVDTLEDLYDKQWLEHQKIAKKTEQLIIASPKEKNETVVKETVGDSDV